MQDFLEGSCSRCSSIEAIEARKSMETNGNRVNIGEMSLDPHQNRPT